MPASQPPVRIRSRVRCRWVTTSGWTEMLTTPASMKGGIRLSGFVTWRWASMGRSTAAAREAATAGPTVRLGTKWLSITSKCTSSAPPLSARRTSSASSAKSAASIEGAPTTLSPSSLKNAKSTPPRIWAGPTHSTEKVFGETHVRRGLLDELEDLEHRQVHGDDDAADDAADDHDHQRFNDRGERLDGGVNLRLVEFRNLGEHTVYVPSLLADGYHAGDHRGKDRLALQRPVDRNALAYRIPTLQKGALHDPVARGGSRYLYGLQDGHAGCAQGAQGAGEAGEGDLLHDVTDLGRKPEHHPTPDFPALLGVLPPQE